MRISFVIPAYNEEKRIQACLDSIINNSRGRYVEILVIDNASDDETAALASQRKEVTVIREDRKGLCYARERGRKAAVGDFLAYIDADSRIPEGWLEFVEQEICNNQDAVCLSGPPDYYDASPFKKLVLCGLWWAAAPLTYHIVGYMAYGAHFVVRKRALDAISGFNCSIEFYGEDTDIARRLRSIGKVLFRMKFRILTSARRFEAEGVVRTAARYAVNYWWPVIFKRPLSREHRDVR